MKREEEHGDSPYGIVSNYLHNQVHSGDTLQIPAPAGEVVLENNDLPIVLISGGIGITPLLSMLNTVTEEQSHRQVTFIHATSTSKMHAFKEQVKNVENNRQNVKSYVCYNSPTEKDKESNNYDKEGYIDLRFLKSILSTKEAHFYLCGSLPFMEAIIKALNEWEIPKEHVHYEAFSPVAILEEE